MKKLFLLLLIFAFSYFKIFALNLDSLNQYTGWDESNPLYKIQKLQINKIDYSKILDSGDKLFTADSNKYFRIWDLNTGKLIYWSEMNYRLPMLLYNDSLIVFWGEKTADPKSPIKIYNLNERKITFVSEVNFRFIPDFFPFAISKENILFVSYSAAAQTTNYFTTKLLLPSLQLDTLSKYETGKTKYLFTKDSNILIREEISEGYNQYTSTWSGKSTLLINNLNQNINSSYDYYGRINEQNSDKKINFSENKCFYYFNRKLTVYNLYDLTKPIKNTLLNDVYSFSIDAFDNLLYYNLITNEIVKYRYSDSSYFTFNLGKNFGNCLILIQPQKEDFVLTSNTGLIIQLNNTKIFSEKPKITPDRVKIIENQDVNFKIITMNNINSAIWDFGDGITSTELNPQHIYLNSGSFTVTLITSNGITSDTVIAKDLIKVEKVFYPIIKADKYFGLAPLTVNFENRTIDCPSDIKLRWNVDSDTSELENNNFAYTFDTGKHIIRMKLIYNNIVYADSVTIEVFESFTEPRKIISSYSFGGYVSPPYARIENDLIYFRELGFGRNVSIIKNREQDKWNDRTSYKALIHNKRLNLTSGINQEIYPQTKICSFPNYGYIVCNPAELSVYNLDNIKLFQKIQDWTSKKLVLLNREKYIGVFDNYTLEVYDKRLDLVKTVYFQELTGNKDSISNVEIIGNESFDYKDFIIILQQNTNFKINKFDIECNLIDSTHYNQNFYKKAYRNNKYLFLYTGSYFHVFNEKLQLINTISLSTYPFDDICGNDNISTVIIEDKLESRGRFYIHYPQITYNLDSFKIDFYGSSDIYYPLEFVFMEDETILLINKATSKTYGL